MYKPNEDFFSFFHADFFVFILLISNQTVFFFSFSLELINSHLRVFQKAKIARAEAARRNRVHFHGGLRLFRAQEYVVCKETL